MESATTKAVCADEEDVERMLPTLPLPLLIFFYRYRDCTGDRLFYPLIIYKIPCTVLKEPRGPDQTNTAYAVSPIAEKEVF